MRLNNRAVRIAAAAAAVGVAGISASAFARVPEPWQLGLQEAASPVMAELNDFHNLLLVIITAITLFVLALLIYVGWRFRASANPTPSRTTHNTVIEVVWTVVPVLILLVIAVPSFRILYFMDRTADPEMTLMANGYQWYWGYEYPDQQIDEYASYMIPDDEIGEGQHRLLSVDNVVVLPVDTNIQILVSAGDVLHSWSMPAFGIKMDAIPGRTNETWVRIEEEGTFYGMCSEICGTGHAFMPIEVHAVSREAFDEWVIDQVADADIDPDNPPVLLTTTYEEAVARRQFAEAAN